MQLKFKRRNLNQWSNIWGVLHTIHARFERVTGEPGDAMNPLPHRLAESDYQFDFWAADTPEGEFPPHMVFQQSSVSDPGLDEIMTHPYSIPFTDIEENDYNPDDYEHIGFPYRLTRRTRINGLDERGISMINTGRGRDLGSVILALDTRNVEQASLSWVAETLQLNSRVYYLRLRYRTSVEEEWNDFKDSFGNLIEFRSDAGVGESRFGDLRLPDDLMEQAYLQLEWRYYHTGERRNMESGARDEIRLDQIEVRTDGSEYQTRRINAYPNPFSREVTLAFDSQTEERGWIEVYTITGRRVKRVELSSSSAGERRQTLNFTGLSSGTYLIRVIQDDDVTHHTIQYIR